MVGVCVGGVEGCAERKRQGGVGCLRGRRQGCVGTAVKRGWRRRTEGCDCRTYGQKQVHACAMPCKKSTQVLWRGACFSPVSCEQGVVHHLSQQQAVSHVLDACCGLQTNRRGESNRRSTAQHDTARPDSISISQTNPVLDTHLRDKKTGTTLPST